MGALGARHAVMLDGGISAQMLIRPQGGAGRQWRGLRPVPLALVVLPRVGGAEATEDSRARPPRRRGFEGVLAVDPNTNTCMRPSLTHLAAPRRNVEAPVPIP